MCPLHCVTHYNVTYLPGEVFFSSTQKSLAEQYSHCFASTIETRSNEPEVPAAALALVATCVCFFISNILCYSYSFQIHSAIDNYSSGLCKKMDFNADLYEDVYKSHIEFLEHIKTASSTKYHCLMADLYINALYVVIYHPFLAADNGSHNFSELFLFVILVLMTMPLLSLIWTTWKID